MRSISPLQALRSNTKIIVIVCLVGMVMASFSVLLYQRARLAMEEQLKERLQSTAAAAAMQFDGALLEVIQSREDMDLPVYRRTATQLESIQDHIPNIRFVYIMRRTEDDNTLQFVADADSLRSTSQLDRNRNGVIDDDEVPSFPGDEYDITPFPQMKEAFLHPTVDPHLTHDQWGTLISGYAPVRRFDNGKIVAILGLDMDAADFESISKSILSPMLILLLAIAVITISTYIIIFLLRRRMEEWHKFDTERAGLMLLTFHQLGGPLTIFKWSIESLRERDPNETLEQAVADHLKNMDDGVQRMDEMLVDLKEAAQVHEDRVEMTVTRGSLRDVIQKTVNEHHKFAQEKHQTIEVDIREEFRMPLDPVLIAKVVSQLLQNAEWYSPEHSVITVRVRRDNHLVRIEVEDHGCGIGKEDEDRIFHKFTRGGNAPILRPDGNGLGLFIARGFVQRMGGTIWLESILGKGTTAVFTLPASGIRDGRK